MTPPMIEEACFLAMSNRMMVFLTSAEQIHCCDRRPCLHRLGTGLRRTGELCLQTEKSCGEASISLWRGDRSPPLSLYQPRRERNRIVI